MTLAEDMFYEPSEITKDTVLVRAKGGSRILHVVGCDIISDWTLDGCEAVQKVKFNKMKLCQNCQRLIYTSQGAKDFKKKRKEYENLYKKFSIPSSIISALFINAKAKTEIKNDTIYITSKRDNWYIDYRFNEVHLYHNNYRIGERMTNMNSFAVDKGFHEHELYATTNNQKFIEALKQIIKYDFKKANAVHKKKKKPKMKFSELDQEYWGFKN